MVGNAAHIQLADADKQFLIRRHRSIMNGVILRKRKTKKEKREEKEIEDRVYGLYDGARKSMGAIVSFLLSAVFVLAAFGKAGMIGTWAHRFLQYLFGGAFFLVPLTFFIIGCSFIIAFRQRILFNTLVGGGLFFLGGLGLATLFFDAEGGGAAGQLIAAPLLRLFDFWATILVLIALLLIGIVMVFNLSLHIPRFRPKSEEGIGGEAEPVVINDQRDGERLSAPAEPLFADHRGATAPVVAMPAASSNAPAKKSLLAGAKKYIAGASPAFQSPPLNLLEWDSGKSSSGDVKANANIIRRTLQNFGIDVEMGEVNIGPSVTQYTLKPAEGIKLARINALQNDLALALAAHPLRLEAPIPGRSLVGIEIPNKTTATVGLRGLLGHEEFLQSIKALLIALGRDVTGKPVFADLARMPHLLIAGSTGSGKSISIHTILTSLLYRNAPDRLRMIIIDPKRVELSLYKTLPHLLAPVIVDAKKAIVALRWAVKEMEQRYERLSADGARDIHSYHQIQSKRGIGEDEDVMPYIIIVIDELADIIAVYPRELEAAIVRLAQMSRAVGIHLIVSTQRPSVEVITGLIKANITSRVAFQVASQIDSRTVIDRAGAERLLGNGDMLFVSGDAAKPRRIQGAFVSENEIKRVVQYLSSEHEQPLGEIDLEHLPEPDSGKNSDSESVDDLYEEARAVIIETGKASSSYLQRRLRVGYARAARLLDILEAHGVVGPGEGAKPREVLMRKTDIDESSRTYRDEERT